MIKAISIFGHKSFHPTVAHVVQIPAGKRATYIYGLNGAGKSAIGEVVDGLSRRAPEFSHCKIETTDGARYRYLVFNHQFVERLIGEPIKGIFTVGEEDKVRQQRIVDIKAQQDVLEAQIIDDRHRVKGAEDAIGKEISRAKDDIWKAYEKGKASTLESLLVGYGNNKEKFFRELRTHALPPDGTLDTLERLEKRWADVSGTETERATVGLDTSVIERIELDPIWEEPIEVSNASRLAPLVAQLDNADWVARGQAYLHEDKCPFCQEGLPHDFRDELARLLEGERKAKVEKIKALTENYAAQVEILERHVERILTDPDAKEAGVELAWSQYRHHLHETLSLLRGKEAQPSKVVAIGPASFDDLAEALAKLNTLIADFNTRIRDRKGETVRIRAMFYQLLHADRQEAYAIHDARIATLQEEEASARAFVETRRAGLEALQVELKELQRQQKGVDASIDAINERLKSLGISAFSIKRHDEQDRLYCLHRPDVPNCSTRTLSEGEKTLIAFLYFMEALKGSHDEDEAIDPEKTIAVIDDPISSLSQNYVYDIATMIHRELAETGDRPRLVKQVIVLTHNLFFFHELVYQYARKNLEKAANKCGLLRVVKNQYSIVEALDPAKLMNDYDVWWHILKDAKARKVPTQIMPNAMRNILEQFFTFTTGSPDFPTAVKQLASVDTSSKYIALDRFVDRGSHSDAVNGPPIDWTDYDADYLLGKLRAMFKAIGQEQHYLMKMGEDAQETVHA